MFNISASQLLLGTLFGAIGFVLFVYGKKQASWKSMVAGAALMGLPYFVPNALGQGAAGLLILAALYFFRN